VLVESFQISQLLPSLIYILISIQMSWPNSFKSLTIIFIVFQYLATVNCFPIIGESSTQETLTTTTLDPKLLSTGLQIDSVNKDDKLNEVPKKPHDSSMFEFWSPESKGD
jgi:hypothetical protein